jgi:hypothetical protein
MMTAYDARAALAALHDTGACGAPTLRSALESLLALDAKVRASLAAEVDVEIAHEARLAVLATAGVTPDQIRAAEDAHTEAVIAAVRAQINLGVQLGR